MNKTLRNIVRLQEAQHTEETLILTLADGRTVSGGVEAFAPPGDSTPEANGATRVMVEDVLVFFAGELIRVADIETVV